MDQRVMLIAINGLAYEAEVVADQPAVAPTVLSRLGLPIPATMKSPPLA